VSTLSFLFLLLCVLPEHTVLIIIITIIIITANVLIVVPLKPFLLLSQPSRGRSIRASSAADTHTARRGK
jgi:hypothetical protein